jgi:hypothetical protein
VNNPTTATKVPNLQSHFLTHQQYQPIKDRLMPFLWQDITELEAVCYKIIRATIRDATKLWEYFLLDKR